MSRKRILCLALLLGSIASSGCRDPGSAQYNGTTSDSAGGPAARARLTIYTRDDSTATGHLSVLSEQISGGFAFGWRTPTGWMFRTASSSGQRILWQASARAPWIEGQELRGTYDVEYGRLAGQRGTFEWTLARGRGLEMRDQRAEFIGTAGIRWEGPLVLLLCAIAIALAIVAVRWLAEAPAALPASTWDSPLRRDLNGVGGWMAWFLIGQAFTSLVMLIQITGVWSQIREGSWLFMGAIPGMRALFALEIVVRLVQIVVPVIGIVLTVRLRPQVPRVWFVYLALIGIYGMVELFLASFINAGVSDVFMGTDGRVRDQAGSASLANFRLAVFASIWILYWIRSDRVRLTFGRQALTNWRHGLCWPWAAWPIATANPTAFAGARVETSEHPNALESGLAAADLHAAATRPKRNASPAATLIGIALLIAVVSYFAITRSTRRPGLEQTHRPNDSLRLDSTERHGSDCTRYGRGCVS